MPTWDEMRRKSLLGVIREVVNGDSIVQSGKAADEVIDRLLQAFRGGEEWADYEIRQALHRGVQQRVTRTLHSIKGAFHFSEGETVMVPTYMGVVVGKDGQPKAFQQQLWFEMSWPVFEKMVDALARQEGVLSRNLRAFQEVLELQRQFPDSRSPGEACAMAGIDPKAFRLEELSS